MHNNKFIQAKADVLKALAHPTRLLITEWLGEGERCVCEFHEIIAADRSTISKHLTILKTAGIVNDQKRGQKVFYSLAVPCVLNFMNCIEEVIATNIKNQISILNSGAKNDN